MARREIPQVGRFRYLVSLEQLSGTQDNTGQVIQSWTTWQQIRCSIEQASGTVRLAGQELFSLISCIMRTRYIDGILPAMRVTWGTRHFQIIAVMDETGKRRFLTLLCQERPESGQAGE
jgi:SPP1 family predicted phage head-tail adaptor